MRSPLALLGAAVIGLLAGSVANAAPIVLSSVGGAPSGVTRENFDGLALGAAGGTTASGIVVRTTPGAAAVRNSVSGLHAAPYLSGDNGAGFGPGGTAQANGADATTYLTSGSLQSAGNAGVELLLPGAQRYFGLLWGSVDDHNALSFYSGANLLFTVTGSQVRANPNGDQAANGTLYVNITNSVAFDRVVATSAGYVFEFDNVAFNPTAVPEPAGLALLGVGVLGLGAARRRRHRAAA